MGENETIHSKINNLLIQIPWCDIEKTGENAIAKQQLLELFLSVSTT